MDLVVAQHAGQTKLFRNASGTPGVRVRLRGTKENPNAIGALVRLKLDTGFSMTREIHAGSGYWSQDSSTLVFGAPAPPQELEVRWPGGMKQVWPWPAGANDVEVSSAGGIKAR